MAGTEGLLALVEVLWPLHVLYLQLAHSTAFLLNYLIKKHRLCW
jgi:hypothetical protein